MVAGTTLAMTAPPMSSGVRPSSAISCVSQTAYSSAVRLASVEARQEPRSVSVRS